MNPIIGRKVVLFPFEITDLNHFVELHRKDRNGFLQRFCLKNLGDEEARSYTVGVLSSGQISVFTVMTKEGKASRIAGYIYISGLTPNSCEISGVMDKQFSKGLGRLVRKDKYTYSEDAFRTLISYLFETINTMNRIQVEIVESNKLSLALVNKVGFTKEGVFRDYLYVDDRKENVVILSLLRKEFQHGWNVRRKQEQSVIGLDSSVPRTSV